MRSSDEILQQAAQDGSIDISEWPRVLESMLQKLRDIVHNDFPLPSVPLPATLPSSIDPEVVNSTPPRLLPRDAVGTQSTDPDILPDADADEDEPPSGSQSSTKENDAPGDAVSAGSLAAPAFAVNHTLAGGPLDNDASSPLPPELFNLYTSSTRILERDFAQSPPYTIQRLAELVLYPRKHYRFLPAYLRALDRVISVSSPVSDFPLPTLHTSPHGAGFLTNGDSTQMNGLSERDGLGSDESLGGALLTPIPWLHNNALISPAIAAANGSNAHDAGELHSEGTTTIDGPNGAGSIETVSVTVNGVPSASSIAHSSPSPTSPTLSEQSDASSSGSSAGSAMTDAQLREQGGVTQGELLRMEQEAGIVPATQHTQRRMLLGNGSVALGRELQPAPALGSTSLGDTIMADEPGAPHARGPEEIGMEDMGPQPTQVSEPGALDIDAAVGRRSRSPQPPPADDISDEADGDATGGLGSPGGPGRDPADVEKDVAKLRTAMDAEQEAEAREEEDTVLADADGRPIVSGGQTVEQEVTGDPGGSEAADTTML